MKGVKLVPILNGDSAQSSQGVVPKRRKSAPNAQLNPMELAILCPAFDKRVLPNETLKRLIAGIHIKRPGNLEGMEQDIKPGGNRWTKKLQKGHFL